ncbi:hypothetical protein POM88_051238 [Heracleum sosnowskyi]|uniref:Uncharacterized protein n=1 Tax=Heracleum sosnowskyi TaxID=360622 RepID=A0AAD8GZ54_9APIA|nr:hypothetical protein POM88_051238 [Heracleum sosnowskyi]
MSDCWYCVVNAPSVEVQPVGQYNPQHQKGRLQKCEIAFNDRVRGFEESKRAAAQKGWSAATASREGIDYGQFIDEEIFGSVEDEAAARDAFKEAFVVYFR